MSVDVEKSCALSSCSLPDDDEMVSCDACRRWWHYGCVDFNPSLFDTATPWLCRSKECKRVGQGDLIIEGEEGNIAPDKDTDADALASVDAPIEAAKVAQSVVEKRNSEIESLKVEMDKLKLQLAAVSSVPAQKNVGDVESAVAKNLTSTRLQAIRKIDRTHRQLLVSSHQATSSTPLSVKPDHHHGNLCNQSDMANLWSILNRNQVQKLPWNKLYSRRAQHLMIDFSRRWQTEYLPEIMRRSKWYKDTKPVEVGSIVLVMEPAEDRSEWKLGKVTTVYPGPDGIVQTADVRLANKVLMVKRAVGRLSVLDVEFSP